MRKKASDICEKCGQPKETYYTKWCPRCDKPPLHTTQTLNLIQALQYIEANGHPGFYDRVWKTLCNRDVIRGNDMTIDIFKADPEDLEFEDEEGLKLQEDLKIIEEVFNINVDEVLFEVSW